MDIRPKTRILKGTFARSSIVASFFSTLFVSRAIVPYSMGAVVPSEHPPLEASVLGVSTGISTSSVVVSETYEIGRAPQDQRAIRLEAFLRGKGSPLAPYSDLIVLESDRYGVDYRLPVAIAALESGYCKVKHAPYNCWGYGSRGWASYEDAIRGYMAGMYSGYFRKGADTPAEIGPIYAADPNWASRVERFIAIIP